VEVDDGGFKVALDEMFVGASCPRKASMTTYYRAFVRDPDGNKIEAVTFPSD
tara:strand:+ start:59 stop:214 length:156 start_codon:yes stop_codon:yes gene_type:complete